MRQKRKGFLKRILRLVIRKIDFRHPTYLLHKKFMLDSVYILYSNMGTVMCHYTIFKCCKQIYELKVSQKYNLDDYLNKSYNKNPFLRWLYMQKMEHKLKCNDIYFQIY